MEQDNLIKKIGDVLQQKDGVRGAWLSGSFGRGDADRYSDIDVVVLVEDSKVDTAFSAFQGQIREISPILFSKTLPQSRTVNAITPEWQRFDLTFVSRQQLEKMSGSHLKELFDLDGAAASIPPLQEAKTNLKPETLTDMTNEFLRVIGLMPVVMGRNELAVGQTGSNLLRDMLVKVMVHENDPQPIRGALSLSRALKKEQIEVLNNLPPVEAKRDSLVQANKTIAENFLPRARALAAKIGAQWPEDFEKGTLSHLRNTLGMDISYGTANSVDATKKPAP